MYCRRYVPVLKDMPLKYLFSPWKAPLSVQENAQCIVGKDYPKPIVDHYKVAKENKKYMEEVKELLKREKGMNALFWSMKENLHITLAFTRFPVQCKLVSLSLNLFSHYNWNCISFLLNSTAYKLLTKFPTWRKEFKRAMKKGSHRHSKQKTLWENCMFHL